MKIKAEQLSRTLKSNSFPLFWLSGDEPLLMQEAADQLRAHFRKQGFEEREIFSVDRGFDWQLFHQSTGNLSLFSERKILDLRLGSSKLDDSGKAALEAYLDEANPDFVVLISSPRLEAATMKTKWFKAIEAKSAVVQIWPINKEGLPSWLEQRLVRAGIQAEPEALQLLIDRIEGNLLAAVQEIEKLKLLANNNDGPIVLNAQTVMQVVADSSRYNAFQVVDAALLGDAVRVQKILQGLRGEDVFPLVILGAITRELRSLLPMIEKRESGQGVNAIIQAHHVWFNRKQAVGSAISRLQSQDIWRMLDHARIIDQSIKGLTPANPWDELSLLLLQIAGKKIGNTELATAAL